MTEVTLEDIERRVRVAKAALLEVNRPDLADLIADPVMICDRLVERGLTPRLYWTPPFLDEDALLLRRAALLSDMDELRDCGPCWEEWRHSRVAGLCSKLPVRLVLAGFTCERWRTNTTTTNQRRELATT